MTDLETRLRRDLSDLSQESPRPPEEVAILRKASVRKGAVAGAGVTGVIAAVVGGLVIFSMITPELPEPTERTDRVVRDYAPPAQRAEVFAIRALADAGLFDPRGDYYSFSEDIEQAGAEAWKIGFGASRCGWFTNKKGARVKTCKALSGDDRQGNARTDSWMTVALSDDTWKVTRLEGNFPSDARETLRFTLRDRNEVPHWEFPTVAFNARTSHTNFEAANLWVGPIPYSGPGSYFRVMGRDQDGNVIYEGDPTYFEAPDEHWQRAGGIFGSGFNRRAAHVSVECAPFKGRGWQPTSIDLEVIGDEAVKVIAPLRFYGDIALNAEAECDALLLDTDGAVLGTGFQQIRGIRAEDEPVYNLSFRIETDRPQDAVSAEVDCRMA